jgi:hypothetical protein
VTTFLRLLEENFKATSLLEAANDVRQDQFSEKTFLVEPDQFKSVPTAPFAYWVSNDVISVFESLPAFESDGRRVERGLFTGDDGRFLRLYWEVAPIKDDQSAWALLSKGGAFSPFYSDIYLCINRRDGFAEIHESIVSKYEYLNGNSDWVLHPECSYGRSGLTYPLRTSSDFSARILPSGCYWTNKGISIFESEEDAIDDELLLSMLCIVNSNVFRKLLGVRMGAAQAAARSYEEGIVAGMPWPTECDIDLLARLGKRAWSLKRLFDLADETSHQFALPRMLLLGANHFHPESVLNELVEIEHKIDQAVFKAYGFPEADRVVLCAASRNQYAVWTEAAGSEASSEARAWAIGVAFARFDLRLATGEREMPPEPKPADPLPAKSPGMLPDGDEPFHRHPGILVDDPGHPHDLPQLIESVVERVDVQAPDNLRRWLQKDFFKEHLKQYSMSRRKAPIYWPLATASGSYTLWVYYSELDDQTLYTAVNDFLEPKLKLVGDELNSLRAKSNRSAAEERELEKQQDLEQELIELRDTILEIAPTYKPNHDDGVQISAAPLWPLFRHKPWQKVLKETWEKLEAGEYDWAHLAYNYWPDRVREKCKTDKSLAIAHNLEELYEEPAA